LSDTVHRHLDGIGRLVFTQLCEKKRILGVTAQLEIKQLKPEIGDAPLASVGTAPVLNIFGDQCADT